VAASAAENKEAVMDSARNEHERPEANEARRAAGESGQRPFRDEPYPYERRRSRDLPYKLPVLAGFLSLAPGLGQIYVGYYQRGFVYALTVATIITLLASGTVHGLEPFFGIFLAFFWLYNIIDALRRASAYNLMLDGLPADELPERIALPEEGASRMWGVVLIVLGAILFLHTKFDMSLEWLEEWWPLIPIGFGVYLLRRGRHGIGTRTGTSADDISNSTP
jgi:hypothetical protein